MEPGFDMQQILQAAQQMQAQLANAQQTLADAELTGTAGGGMVTVKVSGQGELLDLTINPSVIDTSDPAETASTVADLVLAAVRDAVNAAADLQQKQLGFADMLGGFDLSALGMPGGGIPGLPGLGLPGLSVPGSVAGAYDEDFEDDEDLDDEDFDDDEDLDDEDFDDDEEDGDAGRDQG